jgi:hypothetical protein
MPPEVEHEIEEMPVTDVSDDVGEPKGSEKPAIPDSSTGKDVSNRVPDDDPYEIVKDVVAKRKAAPEASSATVEEPATQARDRRPKEPDDENFSDVPFNKHPRFQEILRQRNTYKVDAVRYQNVQNFIDTNGLAPEEAAELLTIGGLMKVNPVEAWKRIEPAVKRLLIAAGEVIPDDLRGLIQQQKMTPEAALEVSRARAATQSVTVQRSFDQQQAERREQMTQSNLRRDAATAWERDRRARDPNFDAKLEAIGKEVLWLQRQEGIPAMPQGVQDQLRRAYENVNKGTSRNAPAARRAVSPVNGFQTGSSDARPAPRNTMEIIQAELAKRNAQ